jgi:hypothetical protein
MNWKRRKAMTHKYERISKVITETLGELEKCFIPNHHLLDHADLVGFAYAILEEFEKDDA